MGSTQPFLGEIKMIAFNYAPKGWAFCNGQTLGIAQNQALFAILGTTYGGNGVNTFALPDLRSRVPVHQGQGLGLTAITLGEKSGEEAHTLIQSEMPLHIHSGPFKGSTAAADTRDPTNATWVTENLNPFSTVAPNTTMAAGALASAGGNQPHPNLQPYLVINYAIALTGIFPSRN